jgi:uncharacterized protein (TIGR02001 family)
MRKTVKLGLLGCLLLAMTTPAVAAIEVAGDAFISANSMYLWRGADLSDGDPVLQAGIDIGFKGFTLGFWSNYQLEDSYLDETDITIDYTFDLTERVALSLGNILYSVDSENTSEVYLGVALNTYFDPTLTIYYDHDDFAGDIFVTASIGHDYELNSATALYVGTLISYADNDAYSKLHNAEFSFGVTYGLTEQLTLGAGGVVSTPLSSKANQVIDNEFMAGLALNLSF